MKFLVCIVLFIAAAQAGVIGVPSAVTYSAGLSPVASVYNAPLTYTAGLSPVASVYNSPLTYSAYSGYPSVYSAGLAAPSVYNAAGYGFASPLVRSAYAAPTVYSSPIVGNTLLKK